MKRGEAWAQPNGEKGARGAAFGALIARSWPHLPRVVLVRYTRVGPRVVSPVSVACVWWQYPTTPTAFLRRRLDRRHGRTHHAEGSVGLCWRAGGRLAPEERRDHHAGVPARQWLVESACACRRVHCSELACSAAVFASPRLTPRCSCSCCHLPRVLQGRNAAGREGNFPSNYVKPVAAPPLPARREEKREPVAARVAESRRLSDVRGSVRLR